MKKDVTKVISITVAGAILILSVPILFLFFKP
jgi:hypothetical protein